MDYKRIKEENIRRDLTMWINSIKESGKHSWRFSFCKDSDNYLLYSSCFAVLALELLGEIKNLSEKEKREWANYLCRFQNNDGTFMDPLINKYGLKNSEAFDEQYLTWQQTYFALNALDAFGEKSNYALEFSDKFKNEKDIKNWLDKLPIASIWKESNRIMWLTYFFYYINDYNKIDSILDWLDCEQDPKTGYWGTNEGADLLQGMGGAYHFYMFYYFRNRKINYVNKIIDSTLSLQLKEGAFSPAGGGACVDLDAVDILVNMSRITDYRHNDVKKALEKAYKSILRQRNKDGSFSEASGREFNILNLMDIFYKSLLKHKNLRILRYYLEFTFKVKFKRNHKIRYSSAIASEYPIRKGDIWSAWFRPLTLALISKRYPGEFLDVEKWVFRRQPGLGYYKESLKTREEETLEFTGERAILNRSNYSQQQRLLNRYIFALKFIKTRDNILDIASGDGTGAYLLSKKAKKVLGADIDEKAIVYASKKYPDLNFAKADVLYNNFKANEFDVIVSFETIEHVKDYKKYLDQIKRILKSNGVFICSTPNNKAFKGSRFKPNNPYHIREFYPEEFKNILNDYFNVIKMYGQDFYELKNLPKRFLSKIFNIAIFPLGDNKKHLYNAINKIEKKRNPKMEKAKYFVRIDNLDKKYSPKEYASTYIRMPRYIICVAVNDKEDSNNA